MNVATLMPTPLPASVQVEPTLDEVNKSDMVYVSVTPNGSNTPEQRTYWSEPLWMGGQAVDIDSHKPLDHSASHWYEDMGSVWKYAGSDFGDAVRAANQLTRLSELKDGTHDYTSTGVVQVKGGAYFVAQLGKNCGRDGLYIDGPQLTKQGFQLNDVKPGTSALKAVVGRDSWINFSDTPLQINLADNQA